MSTDVSVTLSVVEGSHVRPAPRNNNPKLNKALLIINSILAVCSVVISAVHFYYDDMTIGICMLLVLVICLFNAVTAWQALRGKKIEK